MNCFYTDQDHLDGNLKFDRADSVATFSIASLNIIGSIFIITTYLTSKDLWTKSTIIHIFHKNLWYLPYSAQFLLSSLKMKRESNECISQLYISSFSASGSVLGDLWVALDIFFTIYAAVVPSKRMFSARIKHWMVSYIQVGVFMYGFAFVLVCVYYDAKHKTPQNVWSGFFCSFSHKRILMISYYIPLLIKGSVCVAVTTWLLLLICTQQVRKLGVVFKVMVVITIKAIVESVILLSYRCGKANLIVDDLQFAIALCLPGSCFIDAILWVYLPPVWNRLKSLCESEHNISYSLREPDLELSDDKCCICPCGTAAEEHVTRHISGEHIQVSECSGSVRLLEGNDISDDSNSTLSTTERPTTTIEVNCGREIN